MRAHECQNYQLKLARENLAFEIAAAKAERKTAKPFKPGALQW